MKKHELDKICDEFESSQGDLELRLAVHPFSKPDLLPSRIADSGRFLKSSISRGFEVLSVLEGKDDRTQKELQSVIESPWVNTVSLLENVGPPSLASFTSPLVAISDALELTEAAYKRRNSLFDVLETSLNFEMNDADVFGSQFFRGAPDHSQNPARESLSNRVFRALSREAENMRTSSAVVFRAALGTYKKEEPKRSIAKTSIESSVDDMLNSLDSIDRFLEDAESKPISLLQKRGLTF